MSDNERITVTQLARILNDLDAGGQGDLPVITSGCDCSAYAWDPTVEEHEGEPVLWIGRGELA